MTFHENSSSGNNVFPHWQTDGRTDMTKLIGCFRSRKIVKSAWNLFSSEYYIKHNCILCLWFRASLFYINNCPTRCNTKQSIYYFASSLYMFRVSTTPIIRSTQNCNYSLRYWSYFLCSYLPPTWPSLATLEGGSCTVPEAVVKVLCTSDDGCGCHPKHVEWICRIINRLLYVASLGSGDLG